MLLLVWITPLFFLIALVLALAHAFLLGLPAYLVLRGRFRINYASAAALGLVVGAVPVPLYWLVSLLWADATNPIQFPLVQRIQQALVIGALLGAFGGLGGLAFRRVIGPEEEVIDAAIFE